METVAQLAALTPQEAAQVLRGPAIIAVFAATGSKDITDAERTEAMRMAHLNAFTDDPALHDYYKVVERHFETDLDELTDRYHPLNDGNRKALEEEVISLNRAINKLDGPFAAALRRSLSAYAKHVRNADERFVENYLFPFINTKIS